MSRYYFGIAGWSYPDWEGIVYPQPRRGKFDSLVFLTRFFDTIELNNTFYRIPESKMVESWANRCRENPDFRFTAKLWQGFTHGKDAFSVGDVKKFKESMRPLKESKRLGAVLLQFPISCRNVQENRDRVAALVDHFAGFPLVVEFRHRSWIQPEAFAWLEEQKIGFCNVDEPVFRQMIKPSSIVTSETAYVRFHGRNYQNWFSKEGNRDTRYDYLYSEEELDEWIPRIREMGETARDVYVIGNNHFRGQAPANILQLKSRTIQKPVDVPDSMLDSYPQLRKITRARKKTGGQGSLF